MKFRKPRGVLFGLGLGLLVVAAALFYFIPTIAGAGFAYNGLEALVGGLQALITLQFNEAVYLTLFILLCVVLAGFVTSIVVLIQKKRKVHLISLIVAFIFVVVSYILLSIYTLADVNFNGASGRLLSLIVATEGQALGKALTGAVLALTVISNVLLVVHEFTVMYSAIVTDEVNKLEKSTQEANAAAEQAKEEAEAKAQEAEEAIAKANAMEPVVIEKEIDPSEGLEERKEKEEAFFKECLETGYFDEYHEVELVSDLVDAPESDEELVVEEVLLEEESSLITSRNIHVGYNKR